MCERVRVVRKQAHKQLAILRVHHVSVGVEEDPWLRSSLYLCIKVLRYDQPKGIGNAFVATIRPKGVADLIRCARIGDDGLLEEAVGKLIDLRMARVIHEDMGLFRAIS